MAAFAQVDGEGLFPPAELAVAPPTDSPQAVQRRRLSRSGAEIEDLGEDEVLATLTAVRSARGQADAVEAHALARLNQLRGGDRYVADEAALELRLSRNAGQARLARAQALTERMPRLLELLQSGEIEGHTAGRVTDATAVLDDEPAQELDTQLADKVDSGRVALSDPISLVRAARRLVEKLDPHGQAERSRKARIGRRVELLPGEHSMSSLIGELPAEVAAAAYGRVDGIARKLRVHDTRTLDQLRADVYADLLLGHDPGANVPQAAATVFIHLPADAALSMSDEGAELSGYGPIPAVIAREIMTNPGSTWRKVLTDSATGTPQSLGRHRRTPSAFIRDLVAVRDRECSAPGCHRPAQRTDFDHLDDWSEGGTTAVANGGAKCERDHYRKDSPGWIYTHDPASGKTTVTTPGGRTYGSIPDTIVQPRPRTACKSTAVTRAGPKSTPPVPPDSPPF